VEEVIEEFKKSFGIINLSATAAAVSPPFVVDFLPPRIIAEIRLRKSEIRGSSNNALHFFGLL